tara:strand:+ start:386 stop:769 length:384 start_codon:yes stop_codon:yes gene_type:complete
MKITYEQLYRSFPIFKHLLDENLPIRTTRKLQGLVESINPHLQQIEATQSALMEKYSNETDDGVFEIAPENREQFIKELDKYLQYEIVITWELMAIEELGEHMSISIKGLKTISYLLKDYEDVAVIG